MLKKQKRRVKKTLKQNKHSAVQHLKKTCVRSTKKTLAYAQLPNAIFI